MFLSVAVRARKASIRLLSGQAVNLGRHHSRENNMKSSLQIKKISVRRTGDIRLTSAMCTGHYHLAS